MKIENLEVNSTPQELFDAFNSFTLSSDRRVFNKLIARTLLYDKVKNIPGDIVECGVFKGTGMYTFLKLKNLFHPNSVKKVIGFDFFNTEELISSINDTFDKETMGTLFSGRSFEHETSFVEVFENQLLSHGFLKSDFDLVQGDVTTTTKKFVEENPGFKISLLYLDLDLDKPTYDSLNNLWDRVSKGGIVVFDEYGYHKWSESKGVDRFVEEKGLKLKPLDYQAPTAYIKK